MSFIWGNIIGIGCSAIFASSTLPILLSTPPSLIRATAKILAEAVEKKKGKSQYYNLNKYDMETLGHIAIFASFLTPLMTFMPLLILQQVLGDHVTAIMLHLSWLLP